MEIPNEMTKEQAIAFYDSGAWENLTDYQRASLQLTVDKLCMPFDIFHKSIEAVLGRPVYTHEFGVNRHGLLAELHGEQKPTTLDEVIDMIPDHLKAIFVIVDGA